MAAVAERAHADILSDTPLASDPVSVTMPLAIRRSPAVALSISNVVGEPPAICKSPLAILNK
jgi:hypothetical protein